LFPVVVLKMRYSQWVIGEQRGGVNEVSAVVAQRAVGSKTATSGGNTFTSLFKWSEAPPGSIRRSLSRTGSVDLSRSGSANKSEEDDGVTPMSRGNSAAKAVHQRVLWLDVKARSVTLYGNPTMKKALWTVPLVEFTVEHVDESDISLVASSPVEEKKGREMKRWDYTFPALKDLIKWIAAYRQILIEMTYEAEDVVAVNKSAEKMKLEESGEQGDSDSDKEDAIPEELMSDEEDTASEKRLKTEAREKLVKEREQKRLKQREVLRVHQFYKLTREIGEGTFGKVYLGVDTLTGAEFAVKHMVQKPGEETYLRAEMELLKQLRPHRNVVTTHDVFEGETEYYVVMDLVPHGDLYDLIDKGRTVDEPHAAYLMREVLLGVQHLHAQRILHRDVKLDNVLLLYPDGKRQQWPPAVKLTDFSYAIRLEPRIFIVSEASFVGTLLYLAPESIRSRDYGYGVDVWACGVMLFMLIAGKFPFWGEGDREYLKAVVSDALVFPKEDWANVSDSLKDLLRQMLEKRAEDRISVNAALKHNWFSRAFEITPDRPPAANASAAGQLSKKGSAEKLPPPHPVSAGASSAKDKSARAWATQKDQPGKARRANHGRIRKSLERFIPSIVAQAEAEQNASGRASSRKGSSDTV